MKSLGVAMDRHHLLNLFDHINEKYNLKENEYKVFVEALGGRKEPIRLDGAKYVELVVDEYTHIWNHDEESPEVVFFPDRKKILQIINDSSQCCGCQCGGTLNYFMGNNSTTIEKSLLKAIVGRYEKQNAYRNTHINCSNGNIVAVKSINVLD